MRNDNSVLLCPKSALCFGQTFFQFLSHHYETLQYLTYRLPDSALHRWSGALTDLQEELQCQVQHGLEEGAKMEQMLEVKKNTTQQWLVHLPYDKVSGSKPVYRNLFVDLKPTTHVFLVLSFFLCLFVCLLNLF